MNKHAVWYAIGIFLAALALFLGGLAACTTLPHKVGGLKAPESVIQASDGRIFISEINEFDKDGDGRISVIGQDGALSVFAVGMDDPKGLALVGDDLYVADKSRILRVAENGDWQTFAAADAFPQMPKFLNDLAYDSRGGYLYVSDSGDLENGGAIYRVAMDGTVTSVIDYRMDERVRAPNGLLLNDAGDVLLFVDFATGVLYSLNMRTNRLISLAEGLGGGDGLAYHPSNRIYVSDWKNGKLYSMLRDELKLVRAGFQSAADIALTADGKYVLVPDMKAGELVWVPVN